MKLKILIVDDDPDKVAILHAFLASHRHKDALVLDLARTSNDAKRKLREGAYHLMLLDQNMPRRAKEEILCGEGLDILKELDVDPELFRPTHILILSAYEPRRVGELSAADFGWSFLRFDDKSQWRVALASKIDYIYQQVQQHSQNGENSYNYDIGIITALQDPEWSYVQEWDVNWRSEFVHGDYREYFTGEKVIAGKKLKLVGLPVREMGMVGASCAAASLIRLFRPKLVVIGGIAAGVLEEQQIGEVVIGKYAWNYDAGKVLEESGKAIAYMPEPEQVSVDPTFGNVLQGICSAPAFLNRVYERFRAKNVEWVGLHCGPVASGSAVIESPSVIQRILSQNRKARSLDMEVFGVYAACAKSPNPKPLFFSAKAVSDFALPGREESDRRRAAHTSALFLELLLEELAAKNDGTAGLKF